MRLGRTAGHKATRRLFNATVFVSSRKHRAASLRLPLREASPSAFDFQVGPGEVDEVGGRDGRTAGQLSRAVARPANAVARRKSAAGQCARARERAATDGLDPSRKQISGNGDGSGPARRSLSWRLTRFSRSAMILHDWPTINADGGQTALAGGFRARARRIFALSAVVRRP